MDKTIWFIGKDVAEVLGYSNPRKALIDHVDEEDKSDGVTIRDSMGREQQPVIINESGVYSLVLSSKLPKAKEFKHWITSEVLPSIRKHGAYLTDEALKQAIQSPDFLIQLATELKNEKEARKQAEAKIEADAPKVLFADAVSTTDGGILVRQLAKMLHQNGVNMGEKKLFAWMRNNGYLIKANARDYNSPTQRARELGLFEVKVTTTLRSNGDVQEHVTPLVTGKGQQYFINKLLAEKKGA